MNFATPGAGAFIGLAGISLVLAAAIAYVGRQDRRINGLPLIAASYALVATRYVALVSTTSFGAASLLVADLMLVLASVLLIFGSLRMASVTLRERTLGAIATGGTALVLWTAYGGLDREVARIPFSILGAAGQFAFGWALYRLGRDSRYAGYCVAASLAIAVGVLRFLVPLLVKVDLQWVALLLGQMLYVATAVAFVVALQQSQLAEMKTAKRKALQAKRLAHVVFDNSADLMCIARAEPDGRFVIEHANRSMLRAIRHAYPERSFDIRPGRDLEAALREDFALEPAGAERLLGFYREAVRTGAPQTFSASVGHRQMEAVLTPVDSDGRVTHVFYRGTDVTQAREAQEALRRNHERFREIMEKVPVAISITQHEDGRYLYVNPAWCSLQGRARETVLGRTSVELGMFTADERRAWVRDYVNLGGARPLERSYTNAEGRKVHVVLSALRFDLDGEDRVISIAQDVTEAVEGRRRAADLSARFERLFNLCPVPLAVTRFEDGRYLEVNDAWVAFRDCSRERALGKTSHELGFWAHPADRTRMLEALERDGRVQNAMTVFHKHEGKVDSLYSAERIEWNGVSAVLTAIQDVSELIRARHEAQASSDRLTRLFETSPVPVLITRLADGTILEANRAFLDSMGAERSALIGRTTAEVGLWPDSASRERLTRLLRESGTVRSLPVQMQFGASGPRDVLLSVEAIDWKGEEAIVGFQIDVTDMRRATEEIQHLNASLEERVKDRTAELEQALAEMESFTYSVSHDLRAPLRAMTSFAELLAQCPSVVADVQAGAYAWRVSRAASRMGQMVDGLLRYAQLGRQPIKVRNVSLATEVGAIAAALDEQVPGRRLRWEIGPLPEVQADPALLRLVLQNVMENAVKYTRLREEARIEVSARDAEGAVEVTVRDNGIGFDMTYADKLFAPFERLHDEREYDGTGIGLAHARRIIERHGGRMWCDAAPETGAAFTLSLPH